MSQQLFSSESVTEGHPDKVCDRISDAILDALLDVDPRSRVAVETMAATGLIHVAGEVTTEAYVEIPEIVRREILSIGYDSSRVGFDGASCGVSISLDGQSPDIAGGVDEALEVRGTQGGDPRDRLGAGDQGIMFGYASNETNVLMPAPIWLAHRLSERLTKVRKDGLLTELRPDGKTQVTLAYEAGAPWASTTIVVSTQARREAHPGCHRRRRAHSRHRPRHRGVRPGAGHRRHVGPDQPLGTLRPGRPAAARA